MNIQTVSLADYSSLHVGGEGNMCVVTSPDELKEALVYAKKEGLRIYILGGGTNSYFGNNLENILFIKNEIMGVEFMLTAHGYWLTAGSGEIWDDVVRYTTDRGLWGIENLSLIPGTVGAAPVQNIGAYGVELKDVLVSLLAFDTATHELVELASDRCAFGYRDSLFKHEPGRYVIVSIKLQLSSQVRPVCTYKPLDTLVGKEHVTPAEVRELVTQTRTAKLPDWKTTPNNGSFFKNPLVKPLEAEALRVSYPDMPLHEVEGGYKVPAAWLIEHVAQAKGLRVGDVGTWPKQPLVIVNYGAATAEDVNAFAQIIEERVKDGAGIQLEREVNFVA